MFRTVIYSYNLCYGHLIIVLPLLLPLLKKGTNKFVSRIVCSMDNIAKVIQLPPYTWPSQKRPCLLNPAQIENNKRQQSVVMMHSYDMIRIRTAPAPPIPRSSAPPLRATASNYPHLATVGPSQSSSSSPATYCAHPPLPAASF